MVKNCDVLSSFFIPPTSQPIFLYLLCRHTLVLDATFDSIQLHYSILVRNYLETTLQRVGFSALALGH
jgi:hypothetical protein